MYSLTEIKKSIQENERIVSVADAADKEVLLSVQAAIDMKLCSFLLFGDETQIIQTADDIDLDLSSSMITIRHVEKNIAEEAVKAVHHNQAQILMKGHVSTKELLQAVLNKDYGLRTGNILSHVSVFEIPIYDKLLFLTDVAMNISPSLRDKKEIIQNAVQVARSVGVSLPKIAAIAPVEVVNEAMPSTIDAAILTQMNRRGQIKNCVVDGPLAFDNAISVEAAKQKEITSDVAGNADILLVPSIEVGNALYKSFVYFASAKVAAVVSGARAPIVLTSRADSAESKILSLSLALKTINNY